MMNLCALCMKPSPGRNERCTQTNKQKKSRINLQPRLPFEGEVWLVQIRFWHHFDRVFVKRIHSFPSGKIFLLFLSVEHFFGAVNISTHFKIMCKFMCKNKVIRLMFLVWDSSSFRQLMQVCSLAYNGRKPLPTACIWLVKDLLFRARNVYNMSESRTWTVNLMNVLCWTFIVCSAWSLPAPAAARHFPPSRRLSLNMTFSYCYCLSGDRNK